MEAADEGVSAEELENLIQKINDIQLRAAK